MAKRSDLFKRSLSCILSMIMLLSCCLPAFASAEDKTDYVDENKVLHIYGDYSQEYAGEEEYTSIIVEDGGILSGEDIVYDVPVMLVGTVYILSGTSKHNGTIKAGTFNKPVTNNGDIAGGTFTASVNNKNGLITDGTFNSISIDNTSGAMCGGEFNDCNITVARIGIYDGKFNGCTLSLGAIGALYGGEYDKNCNIVPNEGTVGLLGGTYECDISGINFIRDGIYNGTVTNNNKCIIGGGTFNGKVINNGEIRVYEQSNWVEINGEVENNGSISGSVFGDEATVTGNGGVYAIVTILDPTGAEVETVVYDKSFKVGTNVAEGLKQWEKENKSANEWKAGANPELESGAPSVTEISPDATFQMRGGNYYVRIPIWQVKDNVLEIKQDWDGATPSVPAVSDYTSIVVEQGKTLSGGTWTKPVVNNGVISGGSYSSDVRNAVGSEIQQGTFTGSVTNEAEATISGGDFSGSEATLSNEGAITGGTIKTGYLVNTGSVTGAAIGGGESTTVTNNGKGTIKECTFGANTKLDPESDAAANIAVPVNVYKNKADGSPTLYNNEFNYNQNIHNWLAEKYPEDVFSHKDGVEIDETEIFSDLKTYNVVMGYTYRFEWTANDDGSYSAKFYVNQSGRETEQAGVKVTSQTNEPSCVENGVTIYTASIEYGGETYTDEHRIEGGLATGHKYSADKIEWSWSEGNLTATANLSCTKCGTVRAETAEVSNVVDEPTCKNTGKTTYTAKVNVDGQEYTDVREVEIAKLNHTYSEDYEPVWSWTDDYSSATAEFTCEVCSEQTTETAEIEKETVDASCTVAGENIYTATVTVYDIPYKNEVVEEIPMVPHTYTAEPEWNWEGNTAATATFTCAVCENTHEESAKVEESVKAPTCTAEGVKTYTATVTVNGKSYKNEKTESIDKIAHKYGEPTWKWNGYKSATATFTCSECSDKQTVTADGSAITKIVKKTVSCTEDGVNVYTAKVDFGGKSYTNDTTETIAKHHVDNGSNVVKKPEQKATCTEDGYTAGEYCNDCKKWVSGHEIIKAPGHTDKDNNGICDVCEENFDPAKNCSHICHKDGFLGFIWRILRVFLKLFGKSPVCECGLPHY